MSYKELWIKLHPHKDFGIAKCRDLEFPGKLRKPCAGKRCKDCWNEKYEGGIHV